MLAKAVEAYRREQFWRETTAAYSALRADPIAWQELRAETTLWENTLLDGLEDSTAAADSTER